MGDEKVEGHISTVQLMGWVDADNAGGVFGHHCLHCQARFSSKLEMGGACASEAALLAVAVAFAASFHVCA